MVSLGLVAVQLDEATAPKWQRRCLDAVAMTLRYPIPLVMQNARLRQTNRK
jgi:hypothetical protein